MLYKTYANPPLETSLSSSGGSSSFIGKFLRDVRFKVLRTLFRPQNIFPSDIWIIGNRSYVEIILLIAILAFACALAGTSDHEGSGDIAQIAGIITILFSLRNNILNILLGISFERSVFWHRILGSTFIVTALIHGYMNLAGEWEVAGDTQKITGVMMLTVFIAMGLSYFLRHLNFEAFYFVHITLYLSSIPLAFLHEADKFALCCIAWALDLSIRYYFARLTHIAVVSAQPGNIVQVRVDKKLDFTPGQFCFIMIPSVSCVQFHPFTISSSPHQDHFTFNIKASGDWTQKLYDLSLDKGGNDDDNNCIALSKSDDVSDAHAQSNNVSSMSSKEVNNKAGCGDANDKNDSGGKRITMYLEGPFGAPTIDVVGSTYEVLLFVCGGIGVTPCFSFMQFIRQQKRFNTRNIKKLVFIWSSRDADIFDAFSLDIPIESNPQNDLSSDDLVHFELYLTKGGGGKTNLSSKYGTALKHSRPNIVDIVNRTANYAVEHNLERVGVVTCGPAPMIREVEDVCKSYKAIASSSSNSSSSSSSSSSDPSKNNSSSPPRARSASDVRIRNRQAAVCFDVHSEVFDL